MRTFLGLQRKQKHHRTAYMCPTAATVCTIHTRTESTERQFLFRHAKKTSKLFYIDVKYTVPQE